MSTLKNKLEFSALAQNVKVTKDTLIVDLVDGRTIIVPIVYFSRLLNATPEQKNRWRLIGDGEGIHWEEIDEDLSVEGLLSAR